MRNLNSICFLLFLFLITGFLDLSAQSEIHIIDAISRKKINANLHIDNKEGKKSLSFHQKDKFSLKIKENTFIECTAEGYHPITTFFNNNAPKHIYILLDPIHTSQLPKLPQVKHTLSGYIRDQETHRGIPNTQIYINQELVATSDNKGYYIFGIKNAYKYNTNQNIKEPTTLIFKHQDYPIRYKKHHILEGIARVNIYLHTTQNNFEAINHPLLDLPELHQNDLLPAPQPLSNSNCQVPNTIRVGLNCNCTNCTTVEVMSLSTYVGQGLDDEWIASWSDESLKSGAVAYRSYGAYYAINTPLNNGNFDIASSTCNQVYDGSDFYQSCLDAAQITTNEVLSYNNATARSEYSAENNDCGCGDGFSGTGTSWPCINDGINAGNSCFGHGRGLSQWGSQRWAYQQNKDYLWILDHYYSPGNFFHCIPNSNYINNDSCSNAISLDTTNCLQQIWLNGNAFNATPSPNLAQASCDVTTNPHMNDVWFTFTASNAPHTQITVSPSSGFDAVLAVYSGPCSNLQEIACIDNGGGNGASETLDLINILNNGETYFVRVYDFGAVTPTTHNFDICINPNYNNSVHNLSIPSIQIAPNPVGDYLQIESSHNFHQQLEIKIFNLIGQTIYYSSDFLPNKFQIQLPTELPQGIYTIKIQYKTGIFTHKFIKA